jgi:KEOPS complex subunit Cgi121
MEMQREIQVICGAVRIPNLPNFLKTISTIASENKVTIQSLNADLIAGERHLHFAVAKALRAVALGKNVAKDPGIEIMRYAAGERQIERSFSIGLHEGENNAVFVLLGKMDNLLIASQNSGSLSKKNRVLNCLLIPVQNEKESFLSSELQMKK